MPLYEYQCRSCSHRFERIRKFSDPPLRKCPECGGKVQKLVSSPAFQFKGSGWYVTDYARKSESSGSESRDDATKPDKDSKSTKESSGSETSKDSAAKPAEKPASKTADKPKPAGSGSSS